MTTFITTDMLTDGAPSAKGDGVGRAADQDRLRKTGNKVRRRLADNASVYWVTQAEAEIFAVGDFMSPEECRRMVKMIDDTAKPSALFDVDYGSGFRTSYSGDVDAHDPFVKKISRRIDDLLGIDPAWGETIQGQRYLVGQQFKPHNDWFYTTEKYWQIEKNRGGQRSWTAMVFLNDVEAGGSTDFTKLGLSIEPKPGVLLGWNNADRNGVPNEWTIHAGTPVEAGQKYIITKWYRTRRWC